MSTVKQIRVEFDNYEDDDYEWDKTIETLDRIMKELYTDYRVETYMNGILVNQ